MLFVNRIRVGIHFFAKCEHDWTNWESRWDRRKGMIWTRSCWKCGHKEKSKSFKPGSKRRIMKEVSR